MITPQGTVNTPVDLLSELRRERDELQSALSSSRADYESISRQHASLSSAFEQLKADYNRERFTVIKPLMRRIYRRGGAVLRRLGLSAFLERIRPLIPAPDGIPAALGVKPDINKPVLQKILQSPTAADFSGQPDMFVFSIIGWSFRQQRPQHLARLLSEQGRRVFYIDMVMSEGATSIEQVGPSLYLVSLSMTDTGFIRPYVGAPRPESTSGWLRTFYQFCDHIDATGFKQVVIEHPFWWQLVRHLSSDFELIVDCMDDIGGFDNTTDHVLSLEHEMLKQADKLIVSSSYLAAKNKQRDLTMIRNGAEIGHFTTDLEVTGPSFLRGGKRLIDRPGIKAGYVGAIADWFDVELIRSAAVARPDINFHLCGAVTNQAATSLGALQNVQLYGEIAYADVPGFLSVMDVGLIPFLLTPIIQACDPVKFYEYCAAGLPTIATHMPELRRAADICRFAATGAELGDAISEAAEQRKSPATRAKLRRYAEDNTWEDRASAFAEAIGIHPKVSVIIISYGDVAITLEALDSLRFNGGPYPNLQVIVVDNGSPESSLELLRPAVAACGDSLLIEAGENLGFAKANNVGIGAATGDYLLLLNNDAAVAPGAISAMVNQLRRNSRLGAIGPITNNIGNEAKVYVTYNNMRDMRRIARELTTGYRGASSPISGLAYFAVMFRRTDLKQFGELSEDYGIGFFEDDDHIANVRKAGFDVRLAEDAFVHHRLSASFDKMPSVERQAQFARNRALFESRWGPWPGHKGREHRPTPTAAV